MDMPWGVLISLGVVAIAYLLKHFVFEVVEEDHHFYGAIVFYLIIYAAAATAIAFVTPKFTANAADVETTPDGAVRLDAVDPPPRAPDAFTAFIDAIKVKNVLP